MITPAQIRDILAKARAATPGPYRVEVGPLGNPSVLSNHGAIAYMEVSDFAHDDARLFASCDPTTITALCERLLAREEALLSLRRFAESNGYGIPPNLTYDDLRAADYTKGYFAAKEQLGIELDHVEAALARPARAEGEGGA